MVILGASVKDWSDSTWAAQEVILRRLLVLSKFDEEAQAEFLRAFSEKVDFFTCWSAVLMTQSWADLDGAFTRMAGDMRTGIAGNLDRLSSARAQLESARQVSSPRER